jgi:hypothetical protein
MPRRTSSKSAPQVNPYRHLGASSLLRPDVGVQAHFCKKLDQAAGETVEKSRIY